MSQLSPVTFHGDTIFCITLNDQPYAPVKPIVENLGLDWASQTAKLNTNRGRWTVAMIATVAQDGRNREVLCIPVRKLPAFLASINPKKVRAELRPKLELYQAECDDALWDYWSKGQATRKPRQLRLEAFALSAAIDERSVLEFAEEFRQWHQECKVRLRRMHARYHAIAIPLLMEAMKRIEGGTLKENVPALSFDRMLFDQGFHMIAKEPGNYSDTLPDSENPAMYLFDFARAMNAR